MVERTARRQPQKSCRRPRRDAHRPTTSWFGRRSDLASGLASLGLQPQDRVVVQLPNGLEFVVALSGTELHRRHPGDGAARPSPRRDSPFRPVFGAVAYFIADRVGSFDYRPMAAEMAAEFPIAPRTSSWSANRGRTDGLPCRCPRTSRPMTMLLDAIAARSVGCLDDAAVGRDDVAVEADSPDAQRLRLQRAGLRRDGRLLCGHGVHRHAAAGAQLQPGVSRHARRLPRRRHARHRQEHRRHRGVHDGRP